MKRASLLKVWPLSRASAHAWRALLRGDADDAEVVRSVALALACPTSAVQAAGDLIRDGEFEAVEYLLVEDAFVAAAGSDTVRALDAELEQARSTHQSEARARLTELQERAERVGRRVRVSEILQRMGGSRAADRELLAQVEEDIESSEVARVLTLRERLDELSRDALHDPTVAGWRAVVEQALALGAVGEAEAALDRGPSADVTAAIEVPPPPVWPYRDEPLHRVVGWFFGEGVIPPGFERYLPTDDDQPVGAFLSALRRPMGEAAEDLLRALAQVLGCPLLGIEVSSDGLTGRLSDLSAPGLHALGTARWPHGVRVWLSRDTASPDPEVPDGEILVRLVFDRGLHRTQRVLHLRVDDVLAVLHDAGRRVRLLAHLGRQIPLDLAFDTRLADLSTRWARADIPDLLAPGRPPTLLLGAPGMGKSTLLLELARASAGHVVDARESDELPTDPVVLVDGVDATDEARVRRLVREIHWVQTTRTPAPVMVVAARPEARGAFERFGPSMFTIYLLPPRSLGALREQAAAMLGWVGVEAQDLGSYDRMALLAGGNPGVLFQLCRALASVLARAKEGTRTFSPPQLDEAWRSATFRAAVRDLLWAPIAAAEGVAETLRALLEFATPGSPLSLGDLTWAVGETSGERTEEWVMARVNLLAAYGLVDVSGAGIGVAVGGPALLMPGWLRADTT